MSTWGGEHRGEKRRHGLENKTTFVAAVVLNADHHPLAMNLNMVKGFRASQIKRWVSKDLQLGSLIYSVGLACFSTVLDHGCHHYSIGIGIGIGIGPDSLTKEEFTWGKT